MAEPLRKTDLDGKLYRRRAEIEVLIDQLEALPLHERVERIRINSPTDPHFVPPECVLYFVRQSRTENRTRQFEIMCKALIARVERAATVPSAVSYVDGKRAVSARATKIIEEVVSKFLLKLTEDRVSYCGALDYFEVNFAAAAKSWRIDGRRKVDGKDRPLQSLTYNDDQAISPEIEEAAGSFDLQDSERTHDPGYRSALYAAIELLPEEEKQVVLLTLKGCPIDSIDTNAIPMTKMLGCSEKTVRNRRTRAYVKLRSALENLE